MCIMSNVINIFDAQLKKAIKKDTEDDKKASFEEQMRKNKETEERVARERANANKSVLRSYRIKN